MKIIRIPFVFYSIMLLFACTRSIPNDRALMVYDIQVVEDVGSQKLEVSFQIKGPVNQGYRAIVHPGTRDGNDLDQVIEFKKDGVFKATLPRVENTGDFFLIRVINDKAPPFSLEFQASYPNRYRSGYVASVFSDPFHKPDCRWAGEIAPGNLQRFSSRAKAVRAGHRPCKVCKP